MKLIIFNEKTLFFFSILNILYCNQIPLYSSYYYEEKYFRILSNNYEDIVQGEFWTQDKEDNDGIGFKAKKDFGSIILLKDWSMYNFKLTKIIFRNKCSFEYDITNCNAEMWLIHTKDNGYYPPGRRIFIKQNYFTIVVPFVNTTEKNPAVDKIFDFLNLEEYKNEIVYETDNSIKNETKITPKKPVKLYKIIQNQPSLLFEGKYKEKETLFMVFTQYHFISQNNLEYLNTIYEKIDLKVNYTVTFDDKGDYAGKIFRNVKNEDEIKPKVTLMSYSKASFLNTILPFLIIFLF